MLVVGRTSSTVCALFSYFPAADPRVLDLHSPEMIPAFDGINVGEDLLLVCQHLFGGQPPRIHIKLADGPGYQ